MILIACPSCDRQYDVSHVAVGRRVRCACDAVIAVPSRGSLRVAAMHCSHCSGAVEAGETNCRWCGAALSARDRARGTLCPKCFKRLDDDARHCAACGVAIAPQALAPLPEDRACPRCSGELRIRALARDSVVECGACGGLWLSADVFGRLCAAAPEPAYDAFVRAAEAAPKDPGTPAGRTYIPCLGCGELMLRRAFRSGARSSGVVVDFCRGHGVWLDATELERILAFARAAGAAGVEVDPFTRPPGAAAGTRRPPARSVPVRSTLTGLDAIDAALHGLELIVWGLFGP